MKNTKFAIILTICATLVLLSAIGAFVFVNISNQSRLVEQQSQIRKDKIFSECMERTKTKTVGIINQKTWVNKDGDEAYCRKQAEK